MNTANPSRLDRFASKSPLRNHGVGSLFEAQDLSNHGRVALREIPVEAMGEIAVNALGQLPHHPGLPGVVGSGREGDMAWVALEFPNGKLLSAVGRPLEPQAWAKMGAALAGALHAAHVSGVVHGELTNDSVLMCGDRVLLYDLPLVLANRLTDRRGEARLLAQLPLMVSYLAPERFKGLEPTEAGDVYSLAVLLCIAAGADPAPGETALERIHRVTTLAWRPALPLHLPQVHTLLIRMMASDAARRPTMSEVSAQLSALCDQLGVKPPKRPSVSDPFEALVANGVTSRGPDPDAVPTKQVLVNVEAAPTAPGRGRPPPEAHRTPPPVAVSAPVAVTAPSQMTVPTQAARPAVPTPPGKRRTPVPPVLDGLNNTGKMWHLDPIAPPLPASKQPPVLRAATQTQPFGADEVAQAIAKLPTAPSMASVAEDLPLVVGAVVEVEAPRPPVPSPAKPKPSPRRQPVTEPAGHAAAPAAKPIEVVSYAAKAEAPQAQPEASSQAPAPAQASTGEPTDRLSVLTEEKTDGVQPVLESDEQLAAAIKPKRGRFLIPLAAVLVLGLAGGAFWMFGPSLSSLTGGTDEGSGEGSALSFKTPSLSFKMPELPSLSSLLPSSLGGGDDEEQAPRRRRTVRPNSLTTEPAAPVAAEAAKDEAAPSEPAPAKADEAKPAVAAAADEDDAADDDSDEGDAAPADEAPAPKAVKAAPPARKVAPAPKPAPAKVAAAPKPAPRPHVVASSKRGPDMDTPPIEERPAAKAEPARAPSKLGDDDP